jgi:hypothetical protein
MIDTYKHPIFKLWCLFLSDLLMKGLMLFDCDDVSICIGQSERKLMLGSKFYI